MIRNLMKYYTLVVAITMIGTTSFAGEREREAIVRCTNALTLWADRAIPTGNVTYKKGSWIEWDKVWWDNVTCETSTILGVEMVRSLEVDGEYVIFEFFAGEEGRDLFDDIDNDIERAIAVLEARITLLNDVRSEAKDTLQKPNPNFEQVRLMVDDNIRQHLGN